MLYASQKGKDIVIYDQKETRDKEPAFVDNDCNFSFSNDWDFDFNYRY